MENKISSLKRDILQKVIEYYEFKFSDNRFIPEKHRINYAGRTFNEKEMCNLIDASLDFWLTEGRFSELFSEKISEFLNMNYAILTNSGSSANLLAISALTSNKLGDKRLKPGDEVISVAAGFPSSITPIIQNNLIPVFVDIDIPTYNINTDLLENAISEKTKCIFLAHTLGNPYDLDKVRNLVEKYGLWLIEDNCDAFGSKYKNQFTGTFGHISTLSFYPAHHITTGEGGAVITDDSQLNQIIRSFRDWGRDCYCASGENNTCGKRYSQQHGDLPYGYDHKYVYSELGYNLKMTDLQASIGVAQMDKLVDFGKKRKENFNKYFKIFSQHSNYFILPEATKNSDPSWFSFIITLKKECPFTRDDLMVYFNEWRIETRNFFAGNFTKQPAFKDCKHKVIGELTNTDIVMNRTFFLGTYPGMTDDMFKYVERKLNDFIIKYDPSDAKY